jgi:hypothetical protein
LALEQNQVDGQLPRLPGDPNLTKLENIFFTMLQCKSREEEMTNNLTEYITKRLSHGIHAADVSHNRCQPWTSWSKDGKMFQNRTLKQILLFC